MLHTSRKLKHEMKFVFVLSAATVAAVSAFAPTTSQYLSTIGEAAVSEAAVGEVAVVVDDPSRVTPAATSTTETISKPMFDDFLDEEAMFSKSSFPIEPEDLIVRAKEVLSPSVGIGTKDNGDCLAEDFEFCAAVIGPIGRDEYLGALGSFSLEEAFDITPSFFGITVDPTQPNRVWFFNRVKGIHKGEFMGAEPTGKEIIYPPQVLHLDFNAQGKVKEFGFYTADRRQGNTGGLGGAFGFMYGVGKPLPIPECQPYKRSFRFRLLNWVGKIGQKFSKKKD